MCFFPVLRVLAIKRKFNHFFFAGDGGLRFLGYGSNFRTLFQTFLDEIVVKGIGYLGGFGYALIRVTEFSSTVAIWIEDSILFSFLDCMIGD